MAVYGSNLGYLHIICNDRLQDQLAVHTSILKILKCHYLSTKCITNETQVDSLAVKFTKPGACISSSCKGRFANAYSAAVV